MALIKKADVNGRDAEPAAVAGVYRADAHSAVVDRKPAAGNRSGVKAGRDSDAQKRQARTYARQQQAAERISSATTELAAGVAEASAAAEELKKAMQQVAAGAEEASSASDKSTKNVTIVAELLLASRSAADLSVTKAVALQALLDQSRTQIAGSVAAISIAADRQTESVKIVTELEAQATNIGEIVKAVARIADQTNLLALNAAIEAARS